ncbi:MAG: hypothetical protein WC919_07930 [Candidatus Paceibacterota bacterium]|jgi:hypothetical protein
MDSSPNNVEEEEVSLDDEPLDQSHPVPRIPITYEDSDDYAPFDTDSEETQ